MSDETRQQEASGPAPPREALHSPEQDQQQLPDASTRCAACNGEIPPSAAVHEEGLDYVRHFCSSNCQNQWLTQARQQQGTVAPERGSSASPEPSSAPETGGESHV